MNINNTNKNKAERSPEKIINIPKKIVINDVKKILNLVKILIFELIK